MIATYSLNSVHNGIEITFDSFPGKEILDKLHAMKWRWHKYKRCWYNKQTEENLNFAKSICNNVENVVNTEVKENVVFNAHGVKVDDIYYTSWGYDMTIVEFYQVVRVTAKRATVKKIGSKCVEGSLGYSGKVIPVKNNFLTEDTIVTGTDKSYDGKSTILKNCDGNGHVGYKFDGNAICFNSLD